MLCVCWSDDYETSVEKQNEGCLCIDRTWNACVSVIESPRGRSAKRLRRFQSRRRTSILRLTYLENGHIVLSNGVGGFSNWLI